MIIGIPKEIKENEFRVAVIPQNAKEYIDNGHTVYVEKDAGVGAGYSDDEYSAIGAKIVETPSELYILSDMIVKVKEPQPQEFNYIKHGQIIFAYFHLASSKKITMNLLEKQVISIAYETITDENKNLPCLKPMSEIAGRLAIQEGAKYLEKTYGGRGILIGGISGIEPAKVLVLGASGVVGSTATKTALELGAEVTGIVRTEQQVQILYEKYGGKVKACIGNTENIVNCLMSADLVISGVLIPGEKAPKLIKREYLSKMKSGSVIVDVSIDQGGVADSSRPTTHNDPIYVVDDIVHYCVANMPGAVPRTSSVALSQSTTPYGLILATKGVKKAMKEDRNLLNGLNTIGGKITILSLATSYDLPYIELARAFD
ncbi:MAG: alanine dehydrogenase [Bacilli bacterium]|jgi:alanine dehydrogenase